MKFIERRDDFNKFIETWNTDIEYILMGASKECIQFIRSMDYLVGYGKLKIKYVIDHDKALSGKNKNLLELSDYYFNANLHNGDNKEDYQRNSYEVKNIDNFDHKDLKICKIIITSDEYRTKYKNFLNKNGLVEDTDYCWYKKICGVWPLILKNKVHLFRTDLLVTEKCTLNCSFCNMYMPYYNNPQHKDVNNIISDLDTYFSKIDLVSIFHIVGGEPFLYPHLKQVIEHIGSNYRNQIDNLLITTNGTIKPKSELIDLINKYKILVSMSNYTKSIPKVANKFFKVKETFEHNNVKYISREVIEWNDFGDPRVSNDMDNKQLTQHFDSCTAPYRGLNNNKLYYCHLNTSAVFSKIHEDNANDFVSLKTVTAENLIKFDLGYTDLGYITFCENCNGCNTGINVPVTPASQGIAN